MKRSITIFALLAMTLAALGSEPSLTITYQPLDGIGSGAITIAQVTCIDSYSHSGQATAIGLISAANIPPTNHPKEGTENLNLASVCGLQFYSSDIGSPPTTLEPTLDATKFVIPKKMTHTRENIIRSCLECLRLCLPEKLHHTPVTLKAKDSDKHWILKIINEFNTHDRRKIFFSPPA